MRFEANNISDSELLMLINGKVKTVIMGLGKQSKKYAEVYCGFDIETTKVKAYNPDGSYTYHSHMWIWMLGINSHVIYGHRWEDFNDILDRIRGLYHLRSSNRLIIWVANLGFEFQHMRKELKHTPTHVFAKEERNPIKFTYNKSFEFRDALAITGGSLAQLAKDYTSTQKAVGDLDYNIERNNSYIPTESEYGYTDNDVIILCEFSQYIFENYIKKQDFLPMTKTGILRHMVKDRCISWACEYFNSKHGYAYWKYQMSIIQPSEQMYNLCMRWVFRGGYVHANIRYSDQIVKGARLADFTSSYPAEMNHAYFPASRFERVDPKDFSKYFNIKCCIMYITFKNIKAKTWHTIESKSKIINASADAIYDNGRLRAATEITVMLTELDYLTYKDFYKWKSEKITALWIADRGKMPQYLLDVLNEVYIHKAEMKKSGLNDTSEYAQYKSYVNSAYGLTVTRLINQDIVYQDDCWDKIPSKKGYDDQINQTVLYPMQGIYVTAHARRNLLKVVAQVHEFAIYCDTDSIYFIDDPKVHNVICNYNKDILRKNIELFGNNPLTNDLGCFDLDDKIYKFKTLGAKRYIKECGGKLNQTISGLPKQTIDLYCKTFNKQPFEVFTKNFEISSNELDAMYAYADEHNINLRWKMLSVYTDDPYTDIVDGIEMTAQSGVALVDNRFKMSLADDYLDLLIDTLKKEGRYNDVKY